MCSSMFETFAYARFVGVACAALGFVCAGCADGGPGEGAGASAGQGGGGSHEAMVQAGAAARDSAIESDDAGDSATAATSQPDAGASDCAALPVDQRLNCACVELVRGGMTAPDSLREACDQILGRDCCSEGQVCLTPGGSGMAGGLPSTSPGRCVARPAGCDSLSCACFDEDPCVAAGLGVCGAAVGPLPEASRTLSCHAQ